ncbi:hypothetical protein [Winogradskyella jejuensis]|uniref:Uncharacterized protein n=1 Tax=Winogradskyella jejuensis TaxID=1089305 RepID=A0A1M5JGB6_9FLAO|nr:hypothetical protein [Winogradskyella jejuensis]SHG39587.1 hypothetical protein SAMN05444148_0015 [Winogradskyella jejuensis]
MRNIFILLLLLTVSISFSQEKIIEIDYTVDYVVPNKKTQSMDTISIGYNKEGKFLWTNSDALAKKFTENNFMSKVNSNNGASVDLVYDALDNRFLLSMLIGNSEFFANMDIESVVPIDDKDGFHENISLITTPISITESLFGKELSVYEFYPREEPNEGLRILFDESLPCKNNTYVSGIINLMLNMTQSTGKIDFDLPEGLFLKAYDFDDNLLIEAINLDTNKKTLFINYNFQIKE